MLARALIVVAAAVGVSGAVIASETPPLQLDLRSASQLAMKTSQQIGSAQASADMSKAEVGKARSGLLPKVLAQSGYAYLSKETIFGNTPVLEHSTIANTVGVQQVIYSGGQLQANVKAARESYAAASDYTVAAKADVLTNVANAYFRARQAKENIAVAQSSVISLEASYNAAKKLNAAGIVTKSDVLRTEVALTSAKENVITAQNDYKVALANLRTAIGLPQNSPVELADQPADTAPDTSAELKPRERPELAASRAILRASESGKSAARASRLPVVALAADFYNEPTGSQFPRRSNSFMVGALVKMNIFDGGLTRANIDEANAAARKAKEDLDAAERVTELQLETARLSLNSDEARVETTSTQVQSAEESLRTLQAGYRQGITPLTDVLAAQSALTTARSGRLSALYDVKVAQVNLLRALGQTDTLLK